MSEIYNSNSIKYGVFKADVKYGTEPGTARITSAIFEACSITRGTKAITRPNEIGSPNGFALVNDWNTGSATIQIPKDPTNGANPGTPQKGDWFVATLDSTIGAEKWVIEHTTQGFEMTGYYKVAVTVRRDNDSALTTNGATT